ncbi:MULTISPECIES: type IV secretion system protein [unclassified Neisseria]|uniref:type IV secretion system protein n=1 Tax=unclassified Neisseria TaxID=2623750 RepID=UPI0026667700|nr:MULTISPECIES: type IV secretion system protein [unclassified Neisseria]MDO1509545.1 type IV secretion system protein [Neisseria sp. MVDL19-042950]MDO1515683.1 type IV secretion system protein [Neisseria sp. MVDL18-041461]MDO1563493.1 type IV secretion system protein [Neisseria sp. MVDL20-010259]
MPSSYFSDAANILMNGMGSNLFSKAGNLISAIAPVFQIGFGIYMLLVVLDYYNRGFDEKAVDLGKRMIGWLVIIACAFNASQYAKIADIAWNLPDNLSGVFGTAEYTASALDSNINNIVETWGKIQAYAAELDWDQISDKLLLYLVGVFIFILGCLFFAVTFAYYLIAKLSLAMVILIGPLFIGSMLFPSTRQWGMNWIGQILNYAITVTFFTILGTLQNDFFVNHMQNVFTRESFSVAEVIMTLPVFITGTILFIIVAWNIPSIASALTGGASANGFSRTLMSIYTQTKNLNFGGRKGGKISKN